jgi:hypothetical protein
LQILDSKGRSWLENPLTPYNDVHLSIQVDDGAINSDGFYQLLNWKEAERTKNISKENIVSYKKTVLQ